MNDEIKNLPSVEDEKGAVIKTKKLGATKSKPGCLRCLSKKECILAAFIFIFWIVVFGAGILISSQPFRESIASWRGPVFSWKLLFAALMVVLTWTPLNIAFLAGAAGLLGVQARRAGLEETELDIPDVTNPYFSALFRGFYIYLLFISGMLLIVDTPFTSPTQDQYLRLAGVLSLASFLVNYKLKLFAKFLRYSAEKIEQQRKGTTASSDISQ
jgi:hypothetical protein